MNSLESFVEEMLRIEMPKEILISSLLKQVEEQPMPSMEKPAAPFDYATNLHGLTFDYAEEKVTIAYKVVDNLYPPVTVSFIAFEVLLEGLALCRRKKKW